MRLSVVRPRPGRRRWSAAGLAVTAALVAACTSATDTTAGPEDRIAAFTAAWQSFDPDAAAGLTDNPPEAAQVLDAVTANLGADTLRIAAGPVTRNGDTATSTATMSWTVDDDTWTYPVTWTWRHTGGGADGWDLVWTPTVVHPQLGERQTIAARATAAEPGVVVDRTGTQLVSPTRVFSVVVVPSQTPDLAATAAALAPVLAPFDPSITPDSITAGVGQATSEAGGGSPSASPASPSAPASAAPEGGADGTARPVQYTVVNLRESDYQQVKPQLDAIPGLIFPSQQRNLPPTRDFARTTLASVNEAVAPRLKGTSGWTVFTVDATGGVLETLFDQPAAAGQRVQLTLDIGLQKSAEQVLAGVSEPAVLLTMQPSTGEILTIAQNPAADALGSIGLTGRYPPGSTFKIVTASAGLSSGLLTPEKVVPCPGTWTVDGRLIRNHDEFDLGDVAVTEAFAYSCNTTFAQVATQLPADALTSMAAAYGIGPDYVVDGVTTLTGAVPAATSQVQKAENGFGQGQVLVTPFGELLMAATAARGAAPTPVLIRGGAATTVDQAPADRSPAVQTGIRTLMRAVVAEGTGTLDPSLGDVYAKTGTAEYVGEDGTPGSHAWVTGYRGDLAFVVFIAGGGESSRSVQLLDQFLRQIPA
ncbi:penicillin-binding protein [Nakamurella flava]|uniref:Penicillin-binding protein n=1 Tax=Nakamurella flava TaxID=2576308 RepID=A0A4U6QKK1_9ACTN|nr:penicillin-binding transpeptidase domain-containing protein [Nakamurella flava]TKV60983.1 penicillin-binding protein [Nakamurella flava]